MNKTKKLLDALKSLREDMRMLRDGEWDGSQDGCQDSIDLATDAILEFEPNNTFDEK